MLSGIGTVLADDPQLDVRLVPTHCQPLRVVVDSAFATPPGARLLAAPGQVLVVGAQTQPERMAALRAAGAALLLLPGKDGRVDLPALLHHLAAGGVGELHVEAGAVLNAALLAADLVDELLVYLAPKLLGPGLDMAALPPLAALDQTLPLAFEDVQRVGDDLRLRLRRCGAADFLQTRQLPHATAV